MNRPFFRYVLLCGLIYCTACTSNSEPHQADPNTPDYSQLPHRLVTGGDTLVYTMIDQRAHLNNPDEYSQRDSTTIELYYPWVDSGSLYPVAADTLNKAIKGFLLRETQGYTTIEGRLQGFINEFEVHYKDMKEFGLPSANWSFDMNIEVLVNTPQIVALRIDQLEYTGGAHANTWTDYKNYALPSGQRLEFSDLLRETNSEQFESLARQAFVRTLQDSSYLELLSDLDSSAFVPPKLFSVEPRGVRFYYQPYDLGSFASEGVSFYLSYQELLPVLDTQYLRLEPVVEGVET